MLQKNLQKLGFTDKEIEIYLAIIELGKSTPANIAKKTGINRTTVYASADTLLKKGVIGEDLGGKSMYLFAENADSLKEFISEEEEELNKKKRLINKTIKEIKDVPIQNKRYSVPQIRFIEERYMEKHLYKNLRKWYIDSLKVDGVCWGFQDHSFAEKYKEWIKWAVEEIPDNNVKLITNHSSIEREMNKPKYKKVRQVKFWKDKIDFSASQWVMGNYIIMLITRQRPNYLVEIHDEVMAHNMREVFKSIWEDIK
jgi:sugar-specific transcriptional regulator TrmB